MGGDFDLRKLDLSPARITAALERGAEVLKKDAVDKVPKDSTALADSAAIRPEGDDAVAVTFSGPYAHWIHEGIEFEHPHGGQAKFLESALLEKKDEALAEVASHLLDDA